MESLMELSKRFNQALAYAAELHAEQPRKGTTIPYISHPLAVAAIVLEHGGDEDEAIAALLHDAIEDAGGDSVRREIRARFGDAVEEIVEGCTDSDVTPKPPWRERKEAYIEHAKDASRSVLLVSASDKLHNGRAILSDYRSLGESLWGRFNGGKEGTLWYYRSLVTVFRNHPLANRPLVDELDRVVTETERLAGLA